MPKIQGKQEQISCQETRASDLAILRLECDEELASYLEKPCQVTDTDTESPKATLAQICCSPFAPWVAFTPGWLGQNQSLPEVNKAAQAQGATLKLPQTDLAIDTVAGGRAASCRPRENLLQA
ncbi:hypothetical protein I79_000221 [Cricetulus griseus]|uniref:Uncharacterized protein n=1 Tax=Cricetulus griseus TaxID=10029 RepID=G3GRS7_CRIGR|nr:hypothetical protein I79_000221 [Cricetulus griseus]